MKWSDLTLKERKQIYDAVRAENPNASYFDIKSQFDLIPEYEDGKDNSVAAVYSLPEVNVYPQNRFGDIARSQGYETAKNWQAVKNATTAGINGFANDPRNTGVVNNANKLQYNMYRNKSRFVDRINNLTPMEFITPLLLPVAGYEINKE